MLVLPVIAVALLILYFAVSDRKAAKELTRAEAWQAGIVAAYRQVQAERKGLALGAKLRRAEEARERKAAEREASARAKREQAAADRLRAAWAATQASSGKRASTGAGRSSQAAGGKRGAAGSGAGRGLSLPKVTTEWVR